jgi:hypothetical protein
MNEGVATLFEVAVVLVAIGLGIYGHRLRQRISFLNKPKPARSDHPIPGFGYRDAQSIPDTSPALHGSASPRAYAEPALHDAAWLGTTAGLVQTVKLSTIAAADNILVVGQKNAGKTTLLQKMLAARASEELYALDPHAKPGKWPCMVVGAGRDYAAIGTALLQIERSMDARFKQLASGEIAENAFSRRSVVADEYRSIADKLNGRNGAVDAGALLLNRISEGRKVGECVLVACHNDTAEALGIAGNTDMKTCFDWVVFMGGLVDSNRTQKCPPDIKAAALKRERPAVAWLTEKNQWFVVDDDLPMPVVSNVSPIQNVGTPVLVRGPVDDIAGTSLPYQYGTGTVPMSADEGILDEKIKLLQAAGVSWNKIGETLQLRGQKQQRNARIRQALGLPDPSDVELVEPE